MPTYTIRITEKIDCLGDKVLVIFEVDHKLDFEDNESQETSTLPILQMVMPRVVMEAIHDFQHMTGGVTHPTTMKYRSIEEAMASFKEKFTAAAFPEEIEIERGA